MDAPHYAFACQAIFVFLCLRVLWQKVKGPNREPIRSSKWPAKKKTSRPGSPKKVNHELLHGSVYARPTVEPGASEQRFSQPSAESPTLAVDARRKSSGVGVFIYDAAKGAARVLAAQSFYPVVKICAYLGVMMMDLVEKQRENGSPDVEKSTATCRSMVNMLQRAEDVLAMRDAHGKTESALFDEVEEAVKQMVEVMKIHRNKNSLSQVAGTPLFKQRLRDAEAAVNGAFKKLKSPLAACAAACIEEHIEEMSANSRRARRQRNLDQVEIPADDVTITAEMLGKGGFGTVYLADYLGRNVACKVIQVDHALGGGLGCHEDDQTLLAGHNKKNQSAYDRARTSQRRSFLRELQMMLHLRSPHTVNIYGAMTSNEHQLVLVMELLVGGSLKALLHSAQPIPGNHSRSIILDICNGMGFLHGKGTVHGDLKPQNVMLDGGGRAKIGDFGTSRLAQHATGTGLVSHTASPAGMTFAYAAPEVLNGKQSSHESDVYSFGMVVWEVLSRETPWSGLVLATMVVRVMVEGARPRIPFGVHPTMDHLVRSCWAQNPEGRPTFVGIKAFLARTQDVGRGG